MSESSPRSSHACSRSHSRFARCRRSRQARVDWPVFGGNTDNTHYSTLNQITPANVRSSRSRGRTRRTTNSRDRRCRRIRSSSTACCTRRARSCASSRSTPRPGASCGASTPNEGRPPTGRFRHRGVVVTGDRVLFNYRNRLFALDKKTGKPIPTFGVEGVVDLREGLGRPIEGLSVSASTPGVVFEDLLIIGSTVPETLPGVAGRHSRVRREDRRAALDLSHHSASRRVRLRHVAGRRVQGDRRRERVGGRHGRSANAASCSPRPDRRRSISTARTAIGDNLFANSCSRSTRAPASASGTSRRAARPVGLGFSGGADARHREARRPHGRRRRADHEDRLRLRASSARRAKPLFPIEYRKVPASTMDGEHAADDAAVSRRAAAVRATER